MVVVGVGVGVGQRQDKTMDNLPHIRSTVHSRKYHLPESARDRVYVARYIDICCVSYILYGHSLVSRRSTRLIKDI